MIYLIYGDQEMLVNKMRDKLAKETLKEISEFNYVILDANKISDEELEDELNSLPFLGDEKVVALTNLSLLINTGETLLSESKLIDYVDNETPGITFIVTIVTSKLDDKKALVKKLKAKAKVVEVNSLNKKELPRIIKQMFNQRKVEITDSALDELLNRIDNDMFSITNEVDKLSTYSDKIHLDDIKALTPKKIEDNVFDLIEALFKKDTNKAFVIYNDLKNLGNEAITIISIIANQIRFLYQILVLRNKGYSESNIANELSVHPYRVKMGLEKVRNYSEYELEDFLDKLSRLDIQIKTGDIDRFVGLELFILEMTN